MRYVGSEIKRVGSGIKGVGSGITGIGSGIGFDVGIWDRSLNARTESKLKPFLLFRLCFLQLNQN